MKEEVVSSWSIVTVTSLSFCAIGLTGALLHLFIWPWFLMMIIGWVLQYGGMKTDIEISNQNF